MRLLALILSSCFHVLQVTLGQEFSVTRHADGDIFTIEGSCTEACTVLSSGTASPYSHDHSASGISVANDSCTCQCNVALPIFREDLRICVNDIHECNVSGFVGNTGLIERVPYVFLPQRGQIVYPEAQISFDGVKTPVCGIAGAQQLGRSGWSELRNLSEAEPPFRLFTDEGRTFLQWVGESGLRAVAEGKVVIARLVCRDASRESVKPGVFTPCVAFRVAGSPSKNNVREVMFSANAGSTHGLSTAEYTAIGVSSVILALIYVASVSLYLHSRKNKKKHAEEPEAALTRRREGSGIVKNNPLLAASRHFESDTNSGLSEDEVGDELPQSDGEQNFENITSAIIHPHYNYLEQEGTFGSGTIIGERLPEEDVRIVETIDNANQQDTPVLPGTQRRKLYFNPAYFDRQLLLAPPPAAIEFLLKIREVISIAKHKMTAKRFVPTLQEIPEEENSSDRSNSASKQRGGSVRDFPARSRRSQGCTGCPGCVESPGNPTVLPAPAPQGTGESRVRAWLEDVKTPEHRSKISSESERNFEANVRIFAKNLEYLKEMARRDLNNSMNANTASESHFRSSGNGDSLMLRTFRNIARSEILENDDKFSISKRSTRSMFEEATYNRYRCCGKSTGVPFDYDSNNKVRKAIENSFIRQMEKSVTLENDRTIKSVDRGKLTTSTDSGREFELGSREWKDVPPQKMRRTRIPSSSKRLPDMIDELPTTKRIMDAVIREMVDVKALDNQDRPSSRVDYEEDSLERSKCNGRLSNSPELVRQSSPTLSGALPMDEEVTMQNAVFDKKTGKVTVSKVRKEISNHRNYCNLPELVSQKPEEYSLVSEVYVNDGYTSPTGSDDSGPEIQYEPEKPGHLTIKVQDSPENYVKLDESEYEPDTLDRKPMKLKINGDVNYEKGPSNEIYVDSLERPAQILLRSRGSFRDEDSMRSESAPLQRGYGSLREIYEARVRSNLKDSQVTGSSKSLNGESEDTQTWKKNKYLTPEVRQARRQRKPPNHPDVVPLPPSEEIYQHPKPPRRVEHLASESKSSLSKNGWDRGRAEAGNPTASNAAPVPIHERRVGIANDDQICTCNAKETTKNPHEYPMENQRVNFTGNLDNYSSKELRQMSPSLFARDFGENSALKNFDVEPRNLSYSRANVTTVSSGCRKCLRSPRGNSTSRWNGGSPRSYENQEGSLSRSYSNALPSSNEAQAWSQVAADEFNVSEMTEKPLANSCSNLKEFSKRFQKNLTASSALIGKVEDSGYLSSTDSNGSNKRLLKHEVSSVSETDEAESICDGASESGAESVGTDSVFFGNFHKFSEKSAFSKSVDSGVDFGVRNPYFHLFGIRNEGGVLERTSFHESDSESESFVTVLPPGNSAQRKGIIS